MCRKGIQKKRVKKHRYESLYNQRRHVLLKLQQTIHSFWTTEEPYLREGNRLHLSLNISKVYVLRFLNYTALLMWFWRFIVVNMWKKMPTRCNRGFYCRSYCLLNMFRAPLRPSSGAQEYYTVVAAYGISCCGFQVAGLVWSWGLCVRFAGCWFT